jgi:hypothetical protein
MEVLPHRTAKSIQGRWYKLRKEFFERNKIRQKAKAFLAHRQAHRAQL